MAEPEASPPEPPKPSTSTTGTHPAVRSGHGIAHGKKQIAALSLGALGVVYGDIGTQCRMMDTSFFLARQTLLASSRPGMAIWREKLFAWMLRNAESAMAFFKLPTNRVDELGSQVEI